MLKDHKALELDKILLQLANETTCPDAVSWRRKLSRIPTFATWSAFCRKRTTRLF